MITYTDFMFTDEDLFNLMPATLAMKLCKELTALDNHKYPTIGAIAELPEALCQGAKAYRVLIGIGLRGDKESPSESMTMDYEVKDNKVVNSGFLKEDQGGLVTFLREHALNRVHI